MFDNDQSIGQHIETPFTCHLDLKCDDREECLDQSLEKTQGAAEEEYHVATPVLCPILA